MENRIDVFLSRKSEDAHLAKEIYDILTSRGLIVFDAEQSLAQMGNADYSEAIDEALEKTIHLIVIGSSAENISSEWIKAEWRFFLNRKRSGKKKGNILSVITSNMSIDDLPVSLQNFEVVFFENGFDKLYYYVGGNKVANSIPGPKDKKNEVHPLPKPKLNKGSKDFEKGDPLSKDKEYYKTLPDPWQTVLETNFANRPNVRLNHEDNSSMPPPGHGSKLEVKSEEKPAPFWILALLLVLGLIAIFFGWLNGREPSLMEEETMVPFDYPEDKGNGVDSNNFPEPVLNLLADMIPVDGGTFSMGCSHKPQYCDDTESPSHPVKVSSYNISKYEVTQSQWQAVMKSNIEFVVSEKSGKGDNYPMYSVSWDDTQEFLKKLNVMTGKNFRLPTEAEWEYAARGGKITKGYEYAGSDNIEEVAWYYENSEGTNHAVGLKQPNELGLYDMTGNVAEWCSDWFEEYSVGEKTNPEGPAIGIKRVLRGGGSSSWAKVWSRVSFRWPLEPEARASDIGFRIVLNF